MYPAPIHCAIRRVLTGHAHHWAAVSGKTYRMTNAPARKGTIKTASQRVWLKIWSSRRSVFMVSGLLTCSGKSGLIRLTVTDYKLVARLLATRNTSRTDEIKRQLGADARHFGWGEPIREAGYEHLLAQRLKCLTAAVQPEAQLRQAIEQGGETPHVAKLGMKLRIGL